jgi:hypothetical protein
VSAKLQSAAAIATVASSGIDREPGGIHQQRPGRRLRIGVAEPREQFPEEGADPVAVGRDPIKHRMGGVQVQGGRDAQSEQPPTTRQLQEEPRRSLKANSPGAAQGHRDHHPSPTWLPAQGDDIVLIKAPAAHRAWPKRWAAQATLTPEDFIRLQAILPLGAVGARCRGSHADLAVTNSVWLPGHRSPSPGCRPAIPPIRTGRNRD